MILKLVLLVVSVDRFRFPDEGRMPMKQVSINTQKRLLFIPYLNISILFLWLYNCICIKNKVSRVSKTLWILFSTAIPLCGLQIIVSSCYSSVGDVLEYINAYIIPLIIGYRLIRYQTVLQY